MPGLFRHLTSALKTGLDSLLSPADDPREAFTDPIQHQRDMVARVREAQAGNKAIRQRLQARATELRSKTERLEAEARKCVVEGSEDIARLALQHRQFALMELKSVEASAAEAQLEEGRIAIIEQRLTAQIEGLRVRQEMTAVRYTAAESQVIVNEAISGVSKELTDLGAAIEQAEQKAEYMQARAGALSQMAGGVTGSDLMSSELLQADIDHAVEQMLRDMQRGADNG